MQAPVFETQEMPTRRRRRRWPWLLIGLLLALVTAGGFLWWQGNSLLESFSEGDKGRVVDSAREALGQEPKRKLPGLRKAQTFLLVGSDVRAGSGETWGRSDTLLLARVYPETHAVSILSLPRDLAVPIPGYGTDKINAAFSYGGPELLIRTVSEWTGVPIDHYFQIGFEGFASMVDSLGGALVPVDQRYFHSNEGLSPLEQYSEIDIKPGYQRLGAEDALAFVRYRHGDSDIYRAARQQIFLREVSRQIKEGASGNLLEIRSLAKSFAEAAASDFDSLPEALSLARTLKEIPSSRIARITMDGTGGLVDGSYLIQVDPETKKETLRLWNNPEYFFAQQSYKRQATPLARTVSTWLRWLKKSDGRPFSDLKGALPGTPARRLSEWDPVPALFNSYFSDLDREITRSQVRTYSADGQAGSRDEKDLPDPGVLPESPSPDISSGMERGLRLCRPMRLPDGWFWPEDSRHDYLLERRPATAIYATRASGSSILWMWSRWSNPPILEEPEDEVLIGKRRYRLYWESGALRIVAWRHAGTWTWITNTLGNDLDPNEMLQLARSCQ